MAGGPAGVPDAPQLTSRELADGLWLAAVMQGAVPNFGQRDDQVTRELERDLSAVEPALTPESTEPDTVFPPPDPGVESESPDEGGARHDVVLKDAEPDDEMSTEAGRMRRRAQHRGCPSHSRRPAGASGRSRTQASRRCPTQLNSSGRYGPSSGWSSPDARTILNSMKIVPPKKRRRPGAGGRSPGKNGGSGSI